MTRSNMYTKMMDQVEPSADLKDRVLDEVRGLTAEVEIVDAEVKVSKLTETHRPKRLRSIMLRTGIVAATLVLFSVGFYVVDGLLTEQVGNRGITENLPGEEAATKRSPFTITAYASEPKIKAESSENIAIFGGSNEYQLLSLSTESESNEETIIIATGCSFGIQGENIVNIEMKLSRGEIYYLSEVSQKHGSGSMTLFNDDGSSKTMYSGPLGSAFNIPVIPDKDGFDLSVTEFGFVISEDIVREDYSSYRPSHRELEAIWRSGERLGELETRWQQLLDCFDGETLEITARYSDGSQETQSYTLQTGNLKCTTGTDGIITVFPTEATEYSPKSNYVHSIWGVLQDSKPSAE